MPFVSHWREFEEVVTANPELRQVARCGGEGFVILPPVCATGCANEVVGLQHAFHPVKGRGVKHVADTRNGRVEEVKHSWSENFVYPTWISNTEIVLKPQALISVYAVFVQSDGQVGGGTWGQNTDCA